MASFSGSIKLSVSGTYTGSVDIGSVAQNIGYASTISLTNGTGADQANMIFTDTRTLAASTTEDLDLAGGLTDVFGTTITFTKIKGIIIKASSSNTNNVVVGGDANGLVNWVGAANDIINVRPGGMFCIMAPDATAYAVTGSTGDILQVANSSSGSSVTYDIILIGIV